MKHNLSEDELDRRLTAAFADLADRAHRLEVPEPGEAPAHPAHVTLLSTPRRAGEQPRRPRNWITPMLAAAAVVAVLAAAGWLLRPQEPSQSPGTQGVATPSPGMTASQSVADATRDGVVQELAAKPLTERFQPSVTVIPGTLTEVKTAQGVWAISRPRFPADDGREPCVGVGEWGVKKICSPEYGEILLLSVDRSRVLRAYPFPSYAPTWLLAGDDGTLYCGRAGDGAVPETMACRIDPNTGKWLVRVFPQNGSQSEWEEPGWLAGNPNVWQVTKTRVTNFLRAELTDGGLRLTEDDYGSTILDPKTLLVRKVER